ncbi:MAG: ABC transporter ATP-binding protein [Bacteroidetes bacterium]|nr:ABC transporter ATP-binding protein [Bacteroidota bacterium]
MLKRIMSYTRPYRKLFTATVVLTFLLSAIAILRPLIIKYTLNEVVEKQRDLSTLNMIGFALIGILIFEAILQFTNIYLTSLLGQNIIKDLRIQVYSHILRLKNSYFDNTPVGMLVTRSVSDIESLNDMFSQGFIVICGDILMLLIFIAVMLANNWAMALVSLSSIPLLLIATNLFKNGVKKTFTEVRNAVASLNTFTNEHIMGMKIVQVFNREKEEYTRFTKINEKHRDANIRSIWYYSVFFPVVEILSAVSTALLVWYAGFRNNSYNISLGDFTFFLMMINMMFRPIRMLADRLNNLQMGMVAAERVFKILDTQETIDDTGTLPAENLRGHIEFKHVWFAYKEENYVLKDLSFRIEPGETVAFVGATGAGKSSIVNLLNRFYEINKGEILLDGKNVSSYKLDELRQSIGIVLQDVYLFNDSILNNITLHNPEISEQQVVEAAKKIGIHDFIMQLPGNYHYNIRERGSMLSAGQKQLIAFIRAYVYDPPVFILDEATSAIDVETEKLLQRAAQYLCQDRTSIIIAHRLVTIQHASKIIVLDKGQILEMGTRDELLDKNGHFRRLHDLQIEGIGTQKAS